MSIYRQRKRAHAAELRRAHRELEQFRASLPIRFGTKLAGSIRTEAWFRDCGLHGGPPELSTDAEEAVETVLKLKRRIRVVCRRIHTPDCSFHEGPHGVSVMETLGMSWDDVWRMVTKDRLPVSAILRLLEVLRTTEQVMPTEERLGKWGFYEGVERWWRLLRHRHRRLLHLLQTAAEREEELSWHSPP
jgi:hypothetical protein